MHRIKPLAAVLLAAVLLAALPLAAAPALASAASPPNARPASYSIDGSNVYPEGVAFDGKYLYTASVTDGAVYRGLATGGSLKLWQPGRQDGRTITAGLIVTGQRLIVVGADTGVVWIYDTRDGHLVSKLAAPVAPGGRAAFLNDVTVTADRTAYVTDSFSPVIYKISPKDIQGYKGQVDGTLKVAFDTSAAIPAPPGGFNGNGIVTTPDGRGLLVIFTTPGVLYRVDLRTGAVAPVPVGGKSLVNGDGLVRRGNELFVVRNFDNVISRVRLSPDGRSGQPGTDFTYPGVDTPTTAVLARGRLVVVNSQFDTLFQGAPLTSEVFSLSSVPVPPFSKTAPSA